MHYQLLSACASPLMPCLCAVWVPCVGGDASLQNGLELGLEMMAGVPPYGHRELLFLVAALSTVDPGRVQDSIDKAKEAKVR